MTTNTDVSSETAHVDGSSDYFDVQHLRTNLRERAVA